MINCNETEAENVLVLYTVWWLCTISFPGYVHEAILAFTA